MASYSTSARSKIPKPNGMKPYQQLGETSRDGNDDKSDSGGVSRAVKSSMGTSKSIYAKNKIQGQQRVEWGSFRMNLERRRTRGVGNISQDVIPQTKPGGIYSKSQSTNVAAMSCPQVSKSSAPTVQKTAAENGTNNDQHAHVSPDSGYLSTKDLIPSKSNELSVVAKGPEQELVPLTNASNLAVPQGSLIPVLSPPAQADDYITVNGHNYRVLNEVGKGGSSKVFQVYDEERKLCLAIKRVDLMDADETVVTAYRNEVDLLKRLQKYPHRVVRMYDYEYSQSEQQLYVVMEKGDTDLASLFRNEKDSQTTQMRQKLSDHMIAFYWLEMLKAVQVIHQEGIIHSDLKPANFLLVAGKLKLIDFGIANAVPANRTSVTRECQMGTLNYISPEAVSYDIKHKVSVKSDVWSLGCILYNMVYGRTPFQHIQNPMSKMAAMLDRKHAIHFPEVPDSRVVDVMKRCLERNPKQRAGIDELLQHPYSNTRDVPVGAVGPVTDNNLRELAETISKASPDTGARLIKAVIENAKGDNHAVQRLASLKFS